MLNKLVVAQEEPVTLKWNFSESLRISFHAQHIQLKGRNLLPVELCMVFRSLKYQQYLLLQDSSGFQIPCSALDFSLVVSLQSKNICEHKDKGIG